MSVTAGERRVVSALVADVAGSTAIGEQLGPARSKFLFDEIVGLMLTASEGPPGFLDQVENVAMVLAPRHGTASGCSESSA